MSRVRIEFNTESPTDGKVFLDGEEISLIRYINLFSSAEDETKLIISRLIDNGNGEPIPEGHGFLEETYDVFKRLREKDNANGKGLKECDVCGKGLLIEHGFIDEVKFINPHVSVCNDCDTGHIKLKK